MNQNQEKTVILLGSGASAASDFRLPTLRGFFSDDAPTELKVFLHWFYQHSNYVDYNLEEVLAYLDIGKSRLPLWGYSESGGDKYPPSVNYESLLQYVIKRVGIKDNGLCESHKQLFTKLQPQDTVITLNYDLVADNAFRFGMSGSEQHNSRVSKLRNLIGDVSFWDSAPPTLLPDEQAVGFYIKLHGSVDWLRCPAPQCPNHHHIFPMSYSAQITFSAGMPCRVCGSALQVYLIPPVAVKRLENRGRLDFLWNIALREITSATRLVIIGLSFAPTDFELRWLVKQALQQRKQKLRELHVIDTAVATWVTNNAWLCGQAEARPAQYPTLSGFLGVGGLTAP